MNVLDLRAPNSPSAVARCSNFLHPRAATKSWYNVDAGSSGFHALAEDQSGQGSNPSRIERQVNGMRAETTALSAAVRPRV